MISLELKTAIDFFSSFLTNRFRFRMNSLLSIGRYLISEFYSISYFNACHTSRLIFKYSEFTGIVKAAFEIQARGFIGIGHQAKAGFGCQVSGASRCRVSAQLLAQKAASLIE